MAAARGAIEAPGRTTTVPREGQEQRTRSRALEPYKVILYNDDVNSMDHVVRSLTRSVPGLGTTKAFQIMLEAHNTGRAVVIVCPLELAELVRSRLESCGLTATIESA
jgi:ATP-dependent Clp protease adaptor protein ClpS